MRSRGRQTAAFAIVVSAIACGSTPKAPPRAQAAAPVSDRCPDLAKPDELAAFDFAKTYAISADAGEKLKAAALTAIDVLIAAERLDADAGIACSQIAHDLGDRGDWRSGTDACAAAGKAVTDARAKIGAKAQLHLVVRTPLCLVETSLVTKCASLCDSTVPASKVRAECTQLAGRCDGNCEGACEPKTAMKCEGTCAGTCDGAVKGVCGGRCVGTCDGKPRNGACLGVCEGKCERGAANGECKGSCTGTCTLTKAGICDGTCAGSCSVELADTKCAGDFKPPEVSSDCRARCELASTNKTECSKPTVGLALTGSRDKEAEMLRIAVDRGFPALLKLLFELGDKGAKRLSNAQAVVDSVRTSYKEMARTGGEGSAVASEKQLSKCFDEALSKATVAAQAARGTLERAIAVRDEVMKP